MQLQAILERLGECPIVPVLSVDTIEQAAPLAEALHQGGITVAEMTLRTPAGLEAISAMKKAVPGMVVGAGTVLSADDVRRSVDIGADFLVSPGASSSLLASMASAGVPAMPGIATPSEALTARAVGLTHLKLFPAMVVGGVEMLKGIAGPIQDLSFMPTGGVTTDNMHDFLSLKNVFAVGGTWIARAEHVTAGDWSGIAARARAATDLANSRKS